jgi:hypothetical protein
LNTFFSQLSGQAENRFYGHLYLLAQYCGFEGQPWLNGYLQHGWNATDGFGNYLGGKRLSNKFVWSKRCELEIRNKGKANVFAIGAPWLYLDDVYPQTTSKTQSGTIAYPSHSAAWSKLIDTSKDYANFLKDKYGSVTVVLHKYDFAQQEVRKNFETLGHSVTTHGIGAPWEKGFDPLFLKNQRDLIAQFSRVVSNSMSTAVLYATSLGLTPEIGGPITYDDKYEYDNASQKGDGSVDWNAKIMAPQNQQILWKTELGLDCKKSPQELRKILGWVPQPKKSIKFFLTRSVDLISGSSKSISLKVLKSTVSK